MTNIEFRTWRRRLDLTQAQVAGRLGLSSRQIGEYERGKTAVPRPVELATQQIERDLDLEYRHAARNA